TFLAQYHWPGPLHEGNGTVLPILDERSSPPQREAVLQILSGKAGNAWFEVVASLVSRVLEPKVAKIEFKVDVKKRRAQVVVPGLLETRRSEEHTSELQSLAYLVCRLLLEKKKNSIVHADLGLSW